VALVDSHQSTVNDLSALSEVCWVWACDCWPVTSGCWPNHRSEQLFDPLHLARWVAECPWTVPGRPSERESRFVIGHEMTQGGRKRRDVVWRDEQTARAVDNLARPASGTRDNGQAGPQCLDERDAKCFGPDIRLAVNIGGAQQRRNVRPLAQESHALSNAKPVRGGLELAQISLVGGSLRSTHDPVCPVADVAQPRERLKGIKMPFERFEPPDLNDDDVVGRGLERSPDRFTL
jgi:hypothetical protein